MYFALGTSTLRLAQNGGQLPKCGAMQIVGEGMPFYLRLISSLATEMNHSWNEGFEWVTRPYLAFAGTRRQAGLTPLDHSSGQA